MNDTIHRHVAKMYPKVAWPVRGRRYVIRRYVNAGLAKYPAVLLAEIRNRFVRYSDGRMDEAGFLDTRFAPITDIGEIKKILTDVDQWLGADHVDEPDLHPTMEPEDA